MDIISQTRANFDLRILEMIQTVLKIDAVAEVIKVFEAAEQGDKDAQARINKAGIGGKAPSGFMVKDLGIVDKETCDALLTAQSAERSLRVMEEIDLFYETQVPGIMMAAIGAKKAAKGGVKDLMHSPSTDVVKAYYKDNVKPAVTHTPAFQYIGSKGDPETLVCAQATHQLAVEYEQNEKLGMKEKMIGQYMKVPDHEAFGRDFQEGFKAHAAQSYQIAADILLEKGYADVAADIRQVSESIVCDQGLAEKNTPERFAKNLIFSQNRLIMTVNSILDPYGNREMPYVGMNQEWENTLAIRGQQSLKCA